MINPMMIRLMFFVSDLFDELTHAILVFQRDEYILSMIYLTSRKTAKGFDL
jgi:hypothetical protein